MKYSELTKTIRTVLEQMNRVRSGMKTPHAISTLGMIAAHESLRGKFRRQQGGGPARGLYQMEKPTHDTVWRESDTIHEVAEFLGYVEDFERLEHDDEYATFVARHYLAMDTQPLPTNPVDASRYCKEYWNGPGKATPEEYLHDWSLWVWEG